MPQYRLTLTKRSGEIREIEYTSRKLAVEHFQKSSYGHNITCAVLERREIAFEPWTRLARMDLMENNFQRMIDSGEGRRSIIPRALDTANHGDGVAFGAYPPRQEWRDTVRNSEEMPF